MFIYKYYIPVTDPVAILLPVGSSILTVINQDEKLQLYAAVEPSAAHRMEKRQIRVFGTEHEMDNDLLLNYIATVTQYDGKLVWHIFEELTLE